MKSFRLATAVLITAYLVNISPASALADSMGRVKAWQIACTTSALKLQPAVAPNYSYQSFRVQNLSATPVYLGGSDVNTTTLGYPICSDEAVCADKAVSLDASPSATFCRAGSSVTVTILGGSK